MIASRRFIFALFVLPTIVQANPTNPTHERTGPCGYRFISAYENSGMFEPHVSDGGYVGVLSVSSPRDADWFSGMGVMIGNCNTDEVFATATSLGPNETEAAYNDRVVLLEGFVSRTMAAADDTTYDDFVASLAAVDLEISNGPRYRISSTVLAMHCACENAGFDLPDFSANPMFPRFGDDQ